ncbi:MAG: hypothetical protein AAFV80_22815 [Bacteroidota bacterium]
MMINLIDGFFALMAFPTMIATILLAPKAMKEARAYFDRINSDQEEDQTVLDHQKN